MSDWTLNKPAMATPTAPPSCASSPLQALCIGNVLQNSGSPISRLHSRFGAAAACPKETLTPRKYPFLKVLPVKLPNVRRSTVIVTLRNQTLNPLPELSTFTSGFGDRPDSSLT
jgi:hypothetical protein